MPKGTPGRVYRLCACAGMGISTNMIQLLNNQSLKR